MFKWHIFGRNLFSLIGAFKRFNWQRARSLTTAIGRLHAPVKNMGAVYKSICNEADTLLLLVISLSEKQIALKVEIEKLMNEGFVHIAKARYIMGSTCVTKMQLPTGSSNPIKPLATVLKKEQNDSWLFTISRRTGSDSTTELSNDCLESSECDNENVANNSSSISSIAKSEAAFKKVLQNDPKSLKKSKIAYPVEDDQYQEYNDELLDEMSNSGSNESLVSVTDPIRLFGILVPNALKQGQVIFKGIVDRLGECATVQSELRETLNKFSHLVRVKHLIEAAAKEMKIDILTPKLYWSSLESSSVSCHSVEEEEEVEEEDDSEGNVSIQKSIRSVFYDRKDVEPQEREASLWGSGKSEQGSED